MKNEGLKKIIAGIVLMLTGTTGLIWHKEVKHKALRLIVLLVSLSALLSGGYLFVSGIDDLAVGKLGDYQLGLAEVQTMRYRDQSELRESLAGTFKKSPEIRRLKFKCNDNSNSFTVYNTFIGILNVPTKSVQCNSGEPLLIFKD